MFRVPGERERPEVALLGVLGHGSGRRCYSGSGFAEFGRGATVELMMFKGWMAVLLALVPAAAFASDGSGMEAAIARSRQLIVVTSDRWSDNHGTLALLERGPGSQWRRVAADVQVMLGRKGLAWGVGLHPQPHTKREGDGKAPAGLFELDQIFGSDARPPSRQFQYQQLTETSEGIDDSASRWYNRLVDRAQLPERERDWTRSEKVRASNPIFRWVVTVKHNWQQQPELGSCIYIHGWQARGVATAGCTAMAAPDLERLVRWLDARKRPLLLQGPREEEAFRRVLATIGAWP
jgi:D-alanyl-D-alanine dipeptidase